MMKRLERLSTSHYNEDELEFKCKICNYDLMDMDNISDNDFQIKPFNLPCNDLICEKCLDRERINEKSDLEYFTCPNCKCTATIEELRKIKYNQEFFKIIKKNFKNYSMPQIISNNSKLRNVKENHIDSNDMYHIHNSICNLHKKWHINNLYCFFHKKKICADCLLEHQFNDCNIKNWTYLDTQSLLHELKTKFIKLNDLERHFNDFLIEIESKLNDHKEYLKLDLFNDQFNLINNFNKIIEESNRQKPFRLLSNPCYQNSTIELNTLINLCKKLKEKTILTNSNCLKFVTNNFKVCYDILNNNILKTVEEFPNLIIHCYNYYNCDTQFFVRYHNDFYIIENFLDESTKLKLIQTKIQFQKGNEFINSADNLKLFDNQILINVHNQTYQFFDIFLYDNIFQVILDEDLPNNIAKTLYFNDKYFLFDFMIIIDINNNYLKISFKCNDTIMNLYIKVIKYQGQQEFLIDHFIIDNVPFYYKKCNTNARIDLQGSYFRIFKLDDLIEINSDDISIKLFQDNVFKGKIESITYFRLINC